MFSVLKMTSNILLYLFSEKETTPRKNKTKRALESTSENLQHTFNISEARITWRDVLILPPKSVQNNSLGQQKVQTKFTSGSDERTQTFVDFHKGF